ncbi:MAG: methyltransferase [Gemmatimonadota bacterium]
MSKRRDPEWRNQGAAGLLLRYLSELDLSGAVLVVEDPLPDVMNALTSAGRAVSAWSRRVSNGKGGDAWPPAGPFALVALRLPRGRDELSMSLHAAASVLQPRGSALVYGAKDEGIHGALGALGDLFTNSETVAIGGHCRVLKGVREAEPPGAGLPGLRASLEEWKTGVFLDYPDLPSYWVSFPGVFAHGRLDHGTRLLLDALPPLPPRARVLDYGCGSGVIGYVASGRGDGVEVDLVDVDAVALEAARENLPGSRIHLREGLPPVEDGPFDAIFSNPPFHRGKAEDPEMIVSMVRGAPALLRPKGMLVFVAQRRLPLEGALHERFRDVTVLAENSTFRVWKGRNPKMVMGRKWEKG